MANQLHRRSASRSFLNLTISLLILCFGNGYCFAQTAAQPHADTQSWNDVQIAVPLNKQVDVLLLGTLRIGRNISHF